MRIFKTFLSLCVLLTSVTVIGCSEDESSGGLDADRNRNLQRNTVESERTAVAPGTGGDSRAGVAPSQR